MLIKDILENKESDIKRGVPISDIEFSKDEIKILTSVPQLVSFKLKNKIPDDFVASNGLIECYEMIKLGDSTYRVLELCAMYNRLLALKCRVYVPQVLKEKV